jgi:hypothetical protein
MTGRVRRTPWRILGEARAESRTSPPRIFRCVWWSVCVAAYTDASAMRRTLSNVYIPWTITLTPVSASDVGSIEASSLLRLSKLNCKVTTSDGTVVSANESNQPQTKC